jgi:hypothetical protein
LLAYGIQHTQSFAAAKLKLGETKNAATAVTPTAKGKYICNCVARLDDDDETGCGAL